jgi:hypothetical protein
MALEKERKVREKYSTGNVNDRGFGDKGMCMNGKSVLGI